MKKKSLTAFLMAAALTMGTLAGCGSKEAPSGGSAETKDSEETSDQEKTDGGEEAGDGEIVKLRIHAIISEQTDGEAVMEALNEYTREKIGVEVEYVFHGGAYGDKIQTIIASGEEYDACFTSSWYNDYISNVAKGAFVDITDMLPEVAPKLYETLPDYMWEASKVDGKIYAVPNQQIVARQLGILLPKDFVEESGVELTDITSLTDITDYAQQAFDNHGARVAGLDMSGTAVPEYCGYEIVSSTTILGVIKMGDESGKVVNLFETPEWMHLLEETMALKEKGLLDGEAAYMQEYNESQRVAKKLSATFSGTYKPGVEAEESQRAGYECLVGVAGDAPYISTSGVIATMQGISSTSKHPEETLKYLELINTDPYAMNLLAYGIEGKHYEKIGDNMIRAVENSGYAHGSSWALGNVFNTYALEGQPEDVWEQTEALNNSAVTSPLLGFSFNQEPVKMEIANITNILKEYESITGGELDITTANAELLSKIKDAGGDKVIEEMQSQVDAFLSSK